MWPGLVWVRGSVVSAGRRDPGQWEGLQCLRGLQALELGLSWLKWIWILLKDDQKDFYFFYFILFIFKLLGPMIHKTKNVCAIDALTKPLISLHWNIEVHLHLYPKNLWAWTWRILLLQNWNWISSKAVDQFDFYCLPEFHLGPVSMVQFEKYWQNRQNVKSFAIK